MVVSVTPAPTQCHQKAFGATLGSSQDLLLPVLREPYGMLAIKPRLSAWKGSALPLCSGFFFKKHIQILTSGALLCLILGGLHPSVLWGHC